MQAGTIAFKDKIPYGEGTELTADLMWGQSAAVSSVRCRLSQATALGARMCQSTFYFEKEGAYEKEE